DTVIENVPVTIFVKDAQDFRYLLINRAGEAYHGIPREQMIGRTAEEVFPKPVADLIGAHDRELVATAREIFYPAHEITTPGNGTRTITSKRLPIFDETGEPQYLLGVIEDITERREAEKERDRNRDFLDLIIENVPATIWVKDARDGRYVLVNRAA